MTEEMPAESYDRPLTDTERKAAKKADKKAEKKAAKAKATRQREFGARRRR